MDTHPMADACRRMRGLAEPPTRWWHEVEQDGRVDPWPRLLREGQGWSPATARARAMLPDGRLWAGLRVVGELRGNTGRGRAPGIVAICVEPRVDRAGALV